jgi:acyl-coenzyme A synthetase/AMP-(fatty) acid ligase
VRRAAAEKPTPEALPRDDNGKITKRRLREAHWAGQSRRV